MNYDAFKSRPDTFCDMISQTQVTGYDLQAIGKNIAACDVQKGAKALKSVSIERVIKGRR